MILGQLGRYNCLTMEVWFLWGRMAGSDLFLSFWRRTSMTRRRSKLSRFSSCSGRICLISSSRHASSFGTGLGESPRIKQQSKSRLKDGLFHPISILFPHPKLRWVISGLFQEFWSPQCCRQDAIGLHDRFNRNAQVKELCWWCRQLVFAWMRYVYVCGDPNWAVGGLLAYW